MKEDPYFMRELEELAIKAQSSFPISTSSAMKENRDRLQKMYRDFSSSYKSLLQPLQHERSDKSCQKLPPVSRSSEGYFNHNYSTYILYNFHLISGFD